MDESDDSDEYRNAEKDDSGNAGKVYLEIYPEILSGNLSGNFVHQILCIWLDSLDECNNSADHTYLESIEHERHSAFFYIKKIKGTLSKSNLFP